MQTEDFDKQYQTKTDDELMQLAAESDQLCPEAASSLRNELSRRRINRQDLDMHHQDDKGQRTKGKPWNRETTYSLFPSLRGIRATVDDWKKYNHQTGEWPRISITFYFLHIAIELVGLVFIVWYGVQHGWSRGRFLLVFAPLTLVDVLVSDWLQGKIRLSELAHHRHKRIQ